MKDKAKFIKIFLFTVNGIEKLLKKYTILVWYLFIKPAEN